MTIELSVSDVRAALLRAAGPEDRGSGEAATLLLGKIFHEVFAELVSAAPGANGLALIAESGPERERRVELLLEHVWQRLTAPRLLRHAAVLQTSSRQVLVLWQALQSLSRWLVDVVVELLESPEARARSHQLEQFIHAEVPLECTLQEPGWREPVRLVGIADSILHVPGRHHFCALELKLGQNTPAVDLGQAALYHLIATRTGVGAEASSVALLRFAPHLEESLVQSAGLVEAQTRLLALIGRLARVAPPPSPDKTPPPPQVASQKVPAPTPTTPATRAEETPSAPATETPAAEPRPAPSPPSPALVSPPSADSPAAHAELGKKLVRAYREYGVNVELREPVQVGPRFLRFDVRLQSGARLDGLRRVSREVQHRLGIAFEPIVSHDAGRLYVDIARPDPETVLFSSVQSQLPAVDPLRGSARVPIGVDPSGRLHFTDIGSDGRSHVLAAGTSGSGKSEWLRVALAGLIASNTPDTLRIATLDPKIVAFNDLEKSSYLWKKDAWWIPGDGQRPASELFGELVEEMERRYGLIHDAGVDKLSEYVEKTGRPLPRIVCVCDEYFALIAADKNERSEIERAVSLLGAKARAAGVHLILATQQPSRATISGTIQTNLPCRVALTLTSPLESNMILGCAGAERLTLRGDLLYKDFGNPVRLQAPYLPEAERVGLLRR